MEIKYEQMSQRSVEWFRRRLGKMTASKANSFTKILKSGKPSTEQTTEANRLISENLSQSPTYSPGELNYLKWGAQGEAIVYEFMEHLLAPDHKLTKCGFVENSEVPGTGVSPDGLIDDDGLLEIKCPGTSTFQNIVRSDEFPEEYEKQVKMQLAITDREKCLLVAYDPRLPIEKSLYIKSYTMSAKERAEFRELLKDYYKTRVEAGINDFNVKSNNMYQSLLKLNANAKDLLKQAKENFILQTEFGAFIENRSDIDPEISRLVETRLTTLERYENEQRQYAEFQQAKTVEQELRRQELEQLYKSCAE